MAFLMDIDNIINTYHKLNSELKIALSDMMRKDDVKIIRQKIIENQMTCPHFSKKYNFVWINNTCPYCGKEHCIKPLEE